MEYNVNLRLVSMSSDIYILSSQIISISSNDQSGKGSSRLAQCDLCNIVM